MQATLEWAFRTEATLRNLVNEYAVVQAGDWLPLQYRTSEQASWSNVGNLGIGAGIWALGAGQITVKLAATQASIRESLFHDKLPHSLQIKRASVSNTQDQAHVGIDIQVKLKV